MKYKFKLSAQLVGGKTIDDATFDRGSIYMGPHVFILPLFRNPGSWIRATIVIAD